jgi:hypothetical protein
MLGSNFFFAFDENCNPKWRLPFPCLEGCRMDGNSCLVVRCPAAKETPVALCGLKRRRFPEVIISGWLHVVVGI